MMMTKLLLIGVLLLASLFGLMHVNRDAEFRDSAMEYATVAEEVFGLNREQVQLVYQIKLDELRAIYEITSEYESKELSWQECFVRSERCRRSQLQKLVSISGASYSEANKFMTKFNQ